MVDRGVGDEPLEAGLRERDQGTPQHADDTDDDDQPGPRPPRLRQDRHRDPHEPERAHLQQDAGQDRGAGRRRLGVRWRQPGVERERRRLHREPHKYRQQHQAAEYRPAVQGCRPGEFDHVEGVRVAADVQADETEQQRQRAEERVEEELQRRPGRMGVPPTGDDEVHADDGQVEEDEEQDQVEGDE